MKKYRFEIQSCIEVEIETDADIEEARIQVIDNLKQYADEMVTSSCWSSNWHEYKEIPVQFGDTKSSIIIHICADCKKDEL